jgi:hypothetical protein
MEKCISNVFHTILASAELEEAFFQEKMRKIAQTLEQYKDQIRELEEREVPTTPPEFISQHKQDTTTFAENITHTTQCVTELLENNAQLWTQLLEDSSLQELQGNEDRVHEEMEELKQ